MIRLTWRQFRAQAGLAAAGLAIVAVGVAITGSRLADLYAATVATCRTQGDCPVATASLLAKDDFLQNGLTALVFVVPALIGIFWGAPLIARELETGTFRLAWTQSVTRERWLAVKLGVVGTTAIAVALLLSLMVTWWFDPIDRVNANRFLPTVFDARNVAPIGYAGFAFALATTAGLLIRRTLPAMAATIAGFVATRLAFVHWIRPHLLAAAHTATALRFARNFVFQAHPPGTVTIFAQTPSIPNAWTLSSRIVDQAGQAPTSRALHAYLQQVCPHIGPSSKFGGPALRAPPAFQDCLAHVTARYHIAVTYQPAGRYWTFQWLELAIFLGVALILVGACVRGVRHRLL